MQNPFQNAILKTAHVLEEAIDAELEEDLDSLRQRRLNQLKEKAKKREELLSKGHGVYSEIANEKEFFEQAKKSEQLVAHFYRESNMACKVMDKHLSDLAKKHLETKFLRVNAEKSPFLTERLKIWMLPTLVLVKNGKTEHSIVGLDEVGGREDFPVENLQWQLSKHGVLDYDGPEPEISKVKQRLNISKGNRSIIGSRHNRDSDSDDDDDY